jgi:uncharacterized membrane protein YgcG
MSRRSRRLQRQNAALEARAKSKGILNWVTFFFVALAVLTPFLAWMLLPDKRFFPVVVLVTWIVLPFLGFFSYVTVKGLLEGKTFWRAALMFFKGWRLNRPRYSLISNTSMNHSDIEAATSDFSGQGGRSGGAGASGEW